MSDLTGTKGGSGVWQRIISEMPAHQVYIEAFWGRGTIALKKRPARCTVGVDRDPAAVEHGRAHGALMFRSDGIQWLRDYFCVPRSSPPCSASPAGAAQDCGVSRALSGGNGDRATLPAASLDVASSAERNGDPLTHGTAARPTGCSSAATFGGVPWIKHFVYLDPPYLGCRGHYRFELTEPEHIELCRLFLALPCPAALSGYRSGAYDAELGGCRSISIPTVNRAGRRVIEILWLNFPPPVAFHDTRFAGVNRRGRERIRRRVKNWRENLAEMTPIERQAVYEACDATFRAGTC